MYVCWEFFLSLSVLSQCGADITSVNNQGHSALDIVNMYTDPRSAGQMKQVLQGIVYIFISAQLNIHSCMYIVYMYATKHFSN